MTETRMTDTRMTAALPNLDVEILHRQLPDQNAEVMTISLKATPSFEAAAGLLPPLMAAQLGSFPTAQPMLLWARWVEAMWRPWLRLAGMPLSIASDTARQGRLPGQS
jgi:hypothetical protein